MWPCISILDGATETVSAPREMGENYKLVSQLTRGFQNAQETGSGGVAMFDAVVTALFRAVLDEACADVPTHETGEKALVAPRPLDSAPKGEFRGELDADNLTAAGRKGPLPPPSMWN